MVLVNPTILSQDTEKYTRRYNRLLDILKSGSEEVIFCRKGHASHLHKEHNGKYTHITGDLYDAEKIRYSSSNEISELNIQNNCKYVKIE